MKYEIDQIFLKSINCSYFFVQPKINYFLKIYYCLQINFLNSHQNCQKILILESSEYHTLANHIVLSYLLITLELEKSFSHKKKVLMIPSFILMLKYK